VNAIQCDLLSIAGHKFYGPKGVGALFIREGVRIEPLIHGVGHESGRRAGTENVILVVGLGKAAEIAAGHLPDAAVAALRNNFQKQLVDHFGDRIRINGHPRQRLPGTLSVSFSGQVGGEILSRLDGVCASTGAACHSGGVKPSAVLTAMGIPAQTSGGTIRFSVGRPTTQEEIDTVVAALKRVLG
jgi:cysteine desulfurase